MGDEARDEQGDDDMTPTYIVTADDNDLTGWTAEHLAEALREPLGALGVSVVLRSQQYGGERIEPDHVSEHLRDKILAIVSSTIEDGETFEVVQYGSDLDPETRKRLVARRGSIYTDLTLASAEAEARSLMQRETARLWTVIRANSEEVLDHECEPDQVFDALVTLGLTADEAARLVA